MNMKVIASIGAVFSTLCFGALVNQRKNPESIAVHENKTAARPIVIRRVVVKKYYLPASSGESPSPVFENERSPLVRFQDGRVGDMSGSVLFPKMREVSPGIFVSCDLHCNKRK